MPAVVLRASSWDFLLRVATLIALGTSAALLVDYVRPDPSFCGVDSGCGAVRDSGFGYLPFFGLGLLPVPVLGVLAFGLLFAATLLRTGELRAKVAAPLALSAGFAGAALILVQIWLEQFCYLCLIVDVSAIFCAVAGFVLTRTGGWSADVDEPRPTGGMRLSLIGWLGLSVLAVSAPVLFPSFVHTGEVPSVIRGMYDPKQVTVVEFFDYQCPHCRDLSPRLKAVAKAEGAKLIYGYTPLPGHEPARQAARASICAAEQGKEDEVTAHFFAESGYSPDSVLGRAQALVPDPQALAACMASGRPDQRIARDTETIKRAEFVGLPTTYIGGSRILGAQDDSVYVDAIRKARDGADRRGVQPWTYWLAVCAAALALVLLTRKKEPEEGSRGA